MKRMKSVLAMLLALAMVFALAACGSSGGDTTTNDTSNDTANTDTSNDTSNDAAADNSGDNSADNSGDAAAPAPSGKTLDLLRIAIYGDSTFTGAFDVSGAYAGTGSGYGIGFLVYDTPFYMDPNGDYQSRIIDSYDWTDDTTLVMQLKDGITFSNGDQLTGEDLLYSLGQMQNSGRRSGYYTLWDIDNSTLSDDGLTVTLKSFEPYAAYYMGLDFFILDKAYVESVGPENMDWFDPAQVVGSGPYTCTSLVSNASASFVKRDDYWGLAYGYDDPYQNIEATQYSDQTTMAIDLESGNVDLALSLAKSDYERLTDNTSDNIETVLNHSNVVYVLAYDLNNNEYLKDIRVREAISHAIDTVALTDAVAGVYGTPADGLFGVDELGHVSGLTYDYNPELAKSLLEEAGYHDGDITLNIAVIGSEPYTTICEILQFYLSEVGINLTIDSLEMMAFITNASTPGFTDLQIYTMMGGNPNREPYIHLDNWYSDSTSPVMSRTPEYDALLDAGATTLDPTERAEIYGQLQQLFYDNVDGIGLYEWNIGYAYNTDKFESIKIASMTNPWLFDAVVK